MSRITEEQGILLSGYLDGELSPEQAAHVEALLAQDPLFRREFDVLKSLAVGTRAAFTAEALPDPMWEDFLVGVYARTERRLGWLLLVVGALLLLAAGALYFVNAPWAPLWLKGLVALPVVGLAVLFVSVLRQRLRAAKTDRYSREVFR